MPSNFLSTNPYIGSRSFQRGERLYGRDSEARDLLSLLVAERIVLLHSPSGAGKTSLIQAALIPALEQRDFRVSPPIRVNRIPEGPGNRYLQSVIASLEDDPAIPTEDRLPAEELATLSLDAYLERRRSNTDEDEVLIFDQFEEVLTVDPIDLAEKHAFFKELGVALRRLHRWALFAIREDYLAALSPFVRPLPTRLSNTFRLDLLGLNAARRAMQGPAESVGVDFTTEAARQLSENLARLVVTGRDGKTEERIGLTVEPVQLQVVCRRLWDQRFADERSGSGDTVVAVRPQITVHDVEAMGSVDQALSDYYRDGIAKAVAAGGAERTIRSWFDRDLITSQGIRGQVLYGSEQMRNLNDVVINALRNVYLIRADERRGSTWYELAHDRLIDPVRTNNRVWFETNLSALQRQTELWIERGQPDSLLFRGEELATAEAWARGFSGTLTADERSFLEKSRAEQARTQRLRNLTIGAVAAAAIASVAFVVALVFFGLARNNERLANENFNKAQTQEALALEQKGLAEQNAAAAQAAERTAVANYELAEANRREAEQNARISKARELAAASLNRLEVDPELSVLLGIAALNATDSGDPPIPAAADALRQAVNASRVKQTIALDDTTAIDAEYATVVQNPAGSRIAALGADGNLRIWTTGGTTDTPIVEPAHSAAGSAIAYSPDGNRLFTSGDDGLLQLWDATSLQPLASVTGSPDFGGARAAAFSPDGERIALANRSPTALVLDATTLQLQTVISTSSTIYHLAFDPSNQVLGIAESDGISLWDAVEGTQVGFFAHQIEVYTLAFSPDGALVISGDDLGTIRIWDVNDATAAGVRPLVTIQGHSRAVNMLYFARSGAWFASAGNDGAIRLWSPDSGRAILSLNGHSGPVTMISGTDSDRSLVSSGNDQTIKRWSLDLLHGGPARSVAYAGEWLVSSGNDRRIEIWRADTGAAVQTLRTANATIPRIAVSAGGELIAHSGGEAALWRRSAPEQPQLQLPPDTTSVAFDAAGTMLVSGGLDGFVRIWDPATLTETLALGPNGPPVLTVDVSRDGSVIASGDPAGQVRIWDVASAGELVPTIMFGPPINRVAFNPEATLVAVGGVIPIVQIYDLRNPDQVTTLAGHSGQISDLAFDRAGTRIATVSRDRTLRIWQVSDGSLIDSISLPADPNSVAWSEDGRTLAIADAAGFVRIIPTDIDALQALAEQRVSRTQLSAAECLLYAIESSRCAE